MWNRTIIILALLVCGVALELSRPGSQLAASAIAGALALAIPRNGSNGNGNGTNGKNGGDHG